MNGDAGPQTWDLGEQSAVFIIAETASSHEGTPEIALQLLHAAARTGADAVKFQLLQGDALLTPDHPKYQSFQQIQMPDAAWKEIFSEAHRLGVSIIAEVFDEASFFLASTLDPFAYKIHSTDLSNPRMLRIVAETGKRLLLSSGGATYEELDTAMSCLQKNGCGEIILLHGFQSFPTKLEDSNLRQIEALHRRYGLVIGYADHVDADSAMAFTLPAMALAAGARVIEKHLTLDRSQQGRDYFSALNPDEFQRFVSFIKEGDVALGRQDDQLSPAEIDYRKLMKKSIVAAMPLDEGDILSEESLAFKRNPSVGLPPTKASALIGTRLVRRKEANALINLEDVASCV